MRNLTLTALLLFMPLWSGCIAFYDHSQCHFKVFDAEQNKPVEGAVVSVSYILYKMPVLNFPKPTETMTNQNGLAELKVANSFARILDISAEGYTPLRIWGFQHDWPIIDNFKNQNENEFIVPIYRNPKPTIEIIVPDGYRGPVALDLIPDEKLIQEKPGKRNFSYKMMPNGYIPVQASPLLYEIDNIYSITARHENGNSISSIQDSPESIDFRLVVSSGFEAKKHLYIIGTEKERDDLDDKIWPVIDGKYGKGKYFDDEVFKSYFKE